MEPRTGAQWRKPRISMGWAPSPGGFFELQEASETPPVGLQVLFVLVLFSCCFFDEILGGFSIPTWLQLGSQNPPKSVKNRCLDALYLGPHF